ncbi:hypothetical protein [Clostridium tyrobutyricum]|jgi:hypothetical protein|uniref:hypothetical protein n=1 Tax=Clostridium tyrobutyricum TaxID=1519 RepID=UPI00242D4F47|nr:hypothetical protein [Clostridium tyrobutyricum]
MSLNYSFYNNIPVFKCDSCGKCSNTIESISYTSIKNRGCCWYFPEYRLIDIKNIIDNNKFSFIHYLVSLPNCLLRNYSIKINGTFLKNKYKDFKNSCFKKYSNFDSSLFFKLCPFSSKNGCSLNFLLRPHPCNLYLCREIINLCSEKYKPYCDERKDYFAYCNYFDECIKQDLIDNHVSLISNINKAIEVIKNCHIEKFNSRYLKPIIFN